jgi:ABC-type bacteriocin/lantibiotic exporter with double-glycine peptidase domain
MGFNKLSVSKFLALLSALSFVALLWLGILKILEGPKFWSGLIGFLCLMIFGAVANYTRPSL